jgi:hypothetical protein
VVTDDGAINGNQLTGVIKLQSAAVIGVLTDLAAVATMVGISTADNNWPGELRRANRSAAVAVGDGDGCPNNRHGCKVAV